MQTYHLGVLILDELNLLTKKPKQGEQHLLETFLQLINVLGVPMYLAGTSESATLFDQTLRNARRVCFTTPIILDRYEPQDSGWSLFLNTLWDYQWIRNRVELTSDMSLAMYDASQGITDIAIKVYASLQEDAIRTESESFTEKDVGKVIPLRLPLLQSALGTLKRGKDSGYEQFRELWSPRDFWLRQPKTATEAELLNQRYANLAEHREHMSKTEETLAPASNELPKKAIRRKRGKQAGNPKTQAALASLEADVIPAARQ